MLDKNLSLVMEYIKFEHVKEPFLCTNIITELSCFHQFFVPLKKNQNPSRNYIFFFKNQKKQNFNCQLGQLSLRKIFILYFLQKKFRFCFKNNRARQFDRSGNLELEKKTKQEKNRNQVIP